MWNKWKTLYTRYFINAIEYRSELIVWFLLSVIPTLILILVWQSIFNSQGNIQGYGLGEIIQYYLLVIFIGELTASHFENWWVRMIREGKIDLFFTRPFSLQQTIFIGDLSRKTVYALLTLPLFAAIWWAMSQVWVIQPFNLSAAVLLGFVVCLAISYAIYFFMGLIIVFMGFWLEGAQSLEHFKWIIVTLLSGSFIPVTFLPDWLKNLVNLLPFKYMYAVPIGLLQGKTTISITELIYPLSFIVCLWIIAQILWRLALKRYTSAGG